MDLRHLRYFVVLAEELHFGRAAQRLGISQPPLSQQIKALERSLDAALFTRTNRRVELTEAGRALVVEARGTLDQAERAVAIVRRAKRGEVGEIKIGFTPSAALIAPFTKTVLAFRRASPGVRLVLEEQATTEQIDGLVERRLQIGFMRSPREPQLPDSLAAFELHREPLMVFMRADHPLAAGGARRAFALGKLASEPFVFFPRGLGTSLHEQVTGLCRKAGFTPRIEQEARGNATILGLVAAGLGVSILPASLRGAAIENVASRPLSTPDAQSSIWLVYLRNDPSPASPMFVALASAHAARPRGAGGRGRDRPACLDTAAPSSPIGHQSKRSAPSKA